MPSFTVKMKHDRFTKGANVFVELDSSGLPIEDMRKANIGQLYIRKTTVNPPPPVITVTVEYES